MNDHARSFDIDSDGRTLVGIAFRWDAPSLVADPNSTPYLEEFARGSTDKTLDERPKVPLLKRHRLDLDPLGVATFERSAEGLMFTAPLSKTREADETLELVNDGAMRSVSVRFRSFKNGRRTSADGVVTRRLEIGLRELSLVPTGFGQHEGAEILTVRSETDTPLRDALRRRLLLSDPV
ncbi:MAG: HK97 family phage prohead protease [Actinomycetota bacterium]